MLRLWAGLGYYRRARDLHRSAKILVAEHGGQFPTDPVVVRRLPGFGQYTTNAVLSQAFDQRLPILEANSHASCHGFLGDEKIRARDRHGAGSGKPPSRIAKRRAGEFNQALMELGAWSVPRSRGGTIVVPWPHCVRRNASVCKSRFRPAPQVAVTKVREIAVVVRRGEQVLLVQRPDDAPRWAKMWEFPHLELQNGETPEALAERCMRDHLGLWAKLGGELIAIRHGVTRFSISMVCLEAELVEGEFRSLYYQNGVWLTLAELTAYPVSSAQNSASSRS